MQSENSSMKYDSTLQFYDYLFLKPYEKQKITEHPEEHRVITFDVTTLQKRQAQEN